MSVRILIVDDNEALVRGLTRTLRNHFQVEGAHSAEVALDVLDLHSFDLILMDLSMPGMSGIQLLQTIRDMGRTELVIMMSGSGSIESAVHALKLGASDFIEKPVRPEMLLVSIRNAMKKSTLDPAPERQVPSKPPTERMIGDSEAMQRIRRLIQRVAPTEGRVLITGQNGTGKELVASAIHEHSSRASGPFIKLNCSAIPADLIESELFGHEKGAFTGAYGRRKGRFELADGGTLFLDEVGDTPLTMQAKLLRVLQDGQFERIGGGTTLHVDVRVLAATNRELPQMVADGKFREDLYYRLNVFPIEMPPLTQRVGDVPALARHFAVVAGMRNRGEALQLSDGAVACLQEHDFPGNVRELQNIVMRLSILADGAEISESDVRLALPSIPRPPRAEPSSVVPPGVTAEELERQRIVAALQESGGRKARAADLLGMSRSTFWRKMKQHGLGS